MISKIVQKCYEQKIEKAKAELSKLSTADVAVKIDFKALGITSLAKEHKLYLNPRDEGLSAQLYAWKIREPLNTYFLHKFIMDNKRNIDVVIDIGSNIGYFPLLEVVSGAKRVLAIEPVRESYTFLEKNMRRFHNVKLLEAAVSNRDGTIRMYVPKKLNLASAVIDWSYLKTAKTKIDKIINVKAYSIKSILERENLMDSNVLIRMDIEGFEKTIISQLTREIYGISLELHSYILGYSGGVALIKRLEKLGYKVKLMTRELDGLVPVIRLLGFKIPVKLYESLIEKRIYFEPTLSMIKFIIKQQKENPHLFVVRK